MRELPLLVLLVGCGDGGEQAFRERAAPILERRCLSPICHGVRPGAEAAGEVVDRAFLLVDVDGAGRIADPAAAYRTVRQRVNSVERAEFSSLLRKPLALAAGGIAHQGGHQFPGKDDADFQALLAWAASERNGSEGAPRSSLTELERQFGDQVLRTLRDRGCMVARCHGPLAFFGGLAFVPPMEGAGGGFSALEIRANHEAARHNIPRSDWYRSTSTASATPSSGSVTSPTASRPRPRSRAR
jgi:hypothetical protein